ncbi:MAG: hypothetical protein H7196_00775 [candidate division SR1 bacterium]|nr:hypothetical protein [candidate division SR1 bacterium]
MNENFYNIPSYPAPSSSQPTLSNTAASSQQIASQFSFDLSGILSGINAFLLAWTIFYSLILVIDFYFYRVKYNDGVVNREKRGVKSLTSAAQIWFSYLLYLILFILQLSFRSQWYGTIFGVLAILYMFIKLIVIDLPRIPIVDKYAEKITKYLFMPFTFLADSVSKALTPPKPLADKKPAPAGDKK